MRLCVALLGCDFLQIFLSQLNFFASSANAGLDDASPQSEDEVEGGLFLNVVVGQRPPILQLLPCEDEALLIRGDALLILDLLLDILNAVGGLDIEGDGLPSQRLHEDLHRHGEERKEGGEGKTTEKEGKTADKGRREEKGGEERRKRSGSSWMDLGRGYVG